MQSRLLCCWNPPIKYIQLGSVSLQWQIGEYTIAFILWIFLYPSLSLPLLFLSTHTHLQEEKNSPILARSVVREDQGSPSIPVLPFIAQDILKKDSNQTWL